MRWALRSRPRQSPLEGGRLGGVKALLALLAQRDPAEEHVAVEVLALVGVLVGATHLADGGIALGGGVGVRRCHTSSQPDLPALCNTLR